MKALALCGMLFCLLSTPAEARRHHGHYHHSHRHHRDVSERHREADKPTRSVDASNNLARRIAIASDTYELSLEKEQPRTFGEGSEPVPFLGIVYIPYETPTIEYVSPLEDWEIPALGLGLIAVGSMSILLGVAHIPPQKLVTGIERWRGRRRYFTYKVRSAYRDLRYRLRQLR